MSAMFFNSAMLDLHHELLDHLCSPTVHGVIPLLHVNRHFRQLAIDRLVNNLKRNKDHKFDARGEDAEEAQLKAFARNGAYVKISVHNPDSRGRTLMDDPRSTALESIRCTKQNFEFESIDWKTLKVTLKPIHPINEEVGIHLPINKAENRVHNASTRLEIVLTGWFRVAANESKTRLFGLELAAEPDRYPKCQRPTFIPKFKRLQDGTIGIYRGKVEPEKGWELHYNTLYTPSSEERRETGELIHPWFSGRFKVDSLKIPLIDFFVPRETCDEEDFYVNEMREFFR